MPEDRRVSGLRERRGGWSVERVLLLLTFLFSTVAFIFSIGVQWAKTTAVEASVVVTRNELHSDYVRADVYAADQRALTAAIDRLIRAIEAIDARGKPQP